MAGQAAATAKPDGHTLLLMSNANAVSVSLCKKLPFDTQKDFAPVNTLGSFDLGLFVPANSRFASLQDLLAYAKAHPARLNVNAVVREAVAAPSVQDKLTGLGMRVAASTPAGQGALLAAEIKRRGDLIRAAKIEVE